MGWRFDPRLLATLEAVVRLGSLEAAAAELAVMPADVARDLGDLERRAGLRVVTREPVRATQAGRTLLEAEAAITATLSRASAELAALAEGTGGELRVGAFAPAAWSLVAPALAHVHAVHPDVRISLRVLEPAECHTALVRGELELAVTFGTGDDRDAVPGGIHRLHLAADPDRSRHLYTCRPLTATTLAAVRTLTDRLADAVAVAESEPSQRGSGE